MRSAQKKIAPHAMEMDGSLLPWSERSRGHKIGYGVRPTCSAGDRVEVAHPGSGPIPLISPTRPNALSARRREAAKAARIAALRQGVAKLERAQPGPSAHLSLGVVEVHAHLPGPGLAVGVLHEIAAVAHADRPAAFGFLFALTAAALRLRPGPALFVASR